MGDNKGWAKALSIIGIVCGGIGFIFCWWLGFLGIIMGLIGLAGNKTLATVAIGVSAVELIMSLVLLF